MFESIEMFYFMSFVATFIGFNILEKAMRSDGKTAPIHSFLAILGGIGGYQYHHFREASDVLPLICWHGFVFLGVSPLLGYVVFAEGILKAIGRITCAVLAWIGSFVWLALKVRGSPQKVFLLSCLPVVLLMIPYAKLWKYRNRKRAQKRHHQNELAKQAQEHRVKQDKKQQEIEERELFDRLAKELGK